MNKLLKILLVFIIFFTVAFKAEAYQIAVWDAFDSAGSSALKLKISGSKMQNINKYNLSLLNPKIYPVIIFTNYRNMDNTIFNSIASYLNKGGKIVVVLPESSAEETSYIQLAKMLGVRVEKIIPLTNSIDVNWVEKTVTNNSLSKGTRIAKVALPNASHLAVFGDIERHESAISLNSKGVVLSWRWSRDGSAFFNEKSMQYVLQELLPKNASGDMSSTTIVANSDDAVGKIHRIREYVEKYQNNPMNYPKDISTAQQNVELSKINEFLASYYAKNSNPKEYSKYIKLSNDAAVCGLVGTDDSSPAENRGIWFDRGTIVSIKSRSEMAKYFEKLKKSGINTVYFETVNDG